MRAIVCKALGDESGLTLDDVPPPALSEDGVRIKVRAAGVNFADGLLIAGTYQDKPALPFIPGFEVAGEVTEVASGVGVYRPGDRVMAVVDAGGYAEQAIARASDVHVMPPSLDFVTAAGFPIAYGTAHHSLAYKARLQPGETLLVHGAAGGVGLAAVEIGRAMSATVIATAGDNSNWQRPMAHGAAHGINYRTRRRPSNGQGADRRAGRRRRLRSGRRLGVRYLFALPRRSTAGS